MSGHETFGWPQASVTCMRFSFKSYWYVVVRLVLASSVSVMLSGLPKLSSVRVTVPPSGFVIVVVLVLTPYEYWVVYCTMFPLPLGSGTEGPVTLCKRPSGQYEFVTA